MCAGVQGMRMREREQGRLRQKIFRKFIIYTVSAWINYIERVSDSRDFTILQWVEDTFILLFHTKIQIFKRL